MNQCEPWYSRHSQPATASPLRRRGYRHGDGSPSAAASPPLHVQLPRIPPANESPSRPGRVKW